MARPLIPILHLSLQSGGKDSLKIDRRCRLSRKCQEYDMLTSACLSVCSIVDPSELPEYVLRTSSDSRLRRLPADAAACSWKSGYGEAGCRCKGQFTGRIGKVMATAMMSTKVRRWPIGMCFSEKYEDEREDEQEQE